MNRVIEVKCLIGAEGELRQPSSLSYDENLDVLYICDMNGNRILKYSFLHQLYHPLEKAGAAKKLVKPLAITYGVDHTLYIVDAKLNCVFFFKNKEWGQIVFDEALDLKLLGSIAVNHGKIYLSDFLNDRICEFEEQGELKMNQIISCSSPYGIYIHDQSLYMTDARNHQIKIYDLVTHEVKHLCLEGITPISITVDSDGDIYFSENRKIYFYDSRREKVELLFDREQWKNYKFHRLYHIGAMVCVGKEKLVFTDTIQNCVYQIIINKH